MPMMMKDGASPDSRGCTGADRLCFQFGGGIHSGALDCIRGTTDFMIEDVLFLLYATLAGMAVYFPAFPHEVPLHRNKQLLSAVLPSFLPYAMC